MISVAELGTRDTLIELLFNRLGEGAFWIDGGYGVLSL
jgi:hypothetical protein